LQKVLAHEARGEEAVCEIGAEEERFRKETEVAVDLKGESALRIIDMDKAERWSIDVDKARDSSVDLAYLEEPAVAHGPSEGGL
jgi:hypothetical protein